MKLVSPHTVEAVITVPASLTRSPQTTQTAWFSTAKVTNLQADSVDGLSANQLARVAYKENHDLFWFEDGRSTLLTVTLTAPQNGFVMLSGGATVRYDTGCANCTAHVRFRIDDTTDTSSSGTRITQGSIVDIPLDRSVTVPVTKGSHTYTLVGSWYDINGTHVAPSDWLNTTLSALFVAFNGAGTSAVPAATPAPAAEFRTAPDGATRVRAHP